MKEIRSPWYKEIMDRTNLVPGYYWLRFPSDHFVCIGYYVGDKYPDGTIREMPWEIVGCDEILDLGPDVEVVEPVAAPNDKRYPVGR